MSTMQTAPAAAPTDYGALLKDAFHAFLKGENLVPLIVGALVLAIGSMTIILGPPLALGYVRTSIKIARGETAKIDDLWSGFQQFGTSLILGLIMAVLITIGFVLLVIPGLVLMFIFSFAFHVLAVRPEGGAADALKESLRLVKAHVVDVFVLWIVAIVANALLSWTVIGGLASAAFTALLAAMLFVRVMRAESAQPF